MAILSSRLTRIIASLLSGMLAFLGFTACSDNDDDNNIQCMYGTPTGHYEIKGSVTDKNDTPVADATIILRSISKDGISTLYPGIKTDSEGKYSLLASGWPTSKSALYAILKATLSRQTPLKSKSS